MTLHIQHTMYQALKPKFVGRSQALLQIKKAAVNAFGFVSS